MNILYLCCPQNPLSTVTFDHLNYDQSGRRGGLAYKGTCCLDEWPEFSSRGTHSGRTESDRVVFWLPI